MRPMRVPRLNIPLLCSPLCNSFSPTRRGICCPLLLMLWQCDWLTADPSFRRPPSHTANNLPNVFNRIKHKRYGQNIYKKWPMAMWLPAHPAALP